MKLKRYEDQAADHGLAQGPGVVRDIQARDGEREQDDRARIGHTLLDGGDFWLSIDWEAEDMGLNKIEDDESD